MALGIGAEDQVNFLEAAPLGPKQKLFAAVLRRAILFITIHAGDIALEQVENNVRARLS
jgi:hypothetical protein